WENFRGLFKSINKGNAALGIHAYNGGLFADDPVLDSLAISNEVCGYFRDLGEFDYKPPYQATGETKVIDVDILGHIFEQSITDLERIRNELDGLIEPQGVEKHKTRRKKEGAFYTPSFITRYIVEQALGGVLRDRFEQLRVKQEKAAKGAAKKALADPWVYQLDKLTKPAKAGLVKFWEAWQDELTTIRILDHACGSGAFLIEAFDQLHATYQQSNDRLAELRGHRTLFDLDKRILENNLYGVDVNQEAIEICRLSLWIKTAERGKALTSLDHSIRVGNSVVDDPAVHPKAFDWQAAFPEVFKQGGFDVVVANPPYIRQEWISEFKPYLQANYKTYHGMADLYVYFYELGLRVLRPGGLMSFIVTNKWMKSGYGEPLRRFFGEHAWIESVVDFGHAKQIFADADVFPSIIVARKPTKAPKPTTARLCSIPRDQLLVDDLSRQIETESTELPLEQLGADTWQLEPPGVRSLMKKIENGGPSLREVIGSSAVFGLKTGFNQAFYIDSATRNEIVSQDSNASEVIRPYIRGQDIRRWVPEWGGYWAIVLKSSNDSRWPWASQDDAERIFSETFPSIHRHLKKFERALRARTDQGVNWWELRSCAYYNEIERPKVCIQRIAFHSRIAIDVSGIYVNDATIFLKTTDPWVVACLNSPAMWYYAFRTFPHKKDEALAMDVPYVDRMPIPSASDRLRTEAAIMVKQLVEATNSKQAMCRTILDWLRVEHSVDKASKKLQSPTELGSDAFVAEVKRIRGKKNPLSVAALKSLRDEHAQAIEPARTKAAEALRLERQLSDLVNEAYGLTADEVALLWKTAPPRMPFAGES
ncbi:MAG: N-6 DNA methylase, partial [Candidatus Paceibacterota bacterium]